MLISAPLNLQLSVAHLTLPSGYHTDLLCQPSDAAAAAAADFPLMSTFSVATFQKLISILTNQEIRTSQRLQYHYHQRSSSFPSHIALIKRKSGQSLPTFKTSRVLRMQRSIGHRRTAVALQALEHHAQYTETYEGVVADVHGFLTLTLYTVNG